MAMDLSKHLEFFDPANVESIHIIGCGAIGSTLAETLARAGVQSMHLYDFDVVTPHNITNQMYREKDIGLAKVNCLACILRDINPQLDIIAHLDGYDIKKPPRLSGYIFLCVDNIDLRREITKQCLPNEAIKAVFDFRMRLTDAQHYAADWSNAKMQEVLLDSMQFTSEEAKAATPINACGSTLSIAPTVRTIVSMGVANFMNFVNGKPLKKLILIDAFNFTVDAF
jgi:molybdopterin/thiamine biosynthesis adenylyltransferase